MRALAALVVAAVTMLSAGCEKAVEMRLIPPQGDDVDTSCVTAVQLTLTGRRLEDETYHCVEVEPGSVRSLQDHNLSGIFDLDLPPFEIIGIQVRGVAAAGGCTEGSAVGPTIFVASSDQWGDEIDLPMRGVLSCADRIDQPTPVRVVDFPSLVADGSCVAVEGLQAQPGDLFPTLLYNNFAGYQWWFYFWTPPQPTNAEGMLTLPYSFSAASTGSCLGLYTFDGVYAGDGCLTPAGRGACGAEAEFHYIPFDLARDATFSIEDQIAFPSAVFGIVLDDQRRPVVGATVTTSTPGAEVRFATPSGTGFTLHDGPGTDASGTFVVLTKRPALVEITKPGMGTRRVMTGGTSATVVMMTPAN